MTDPTNGKTPPPSTPFGGFSISIVDDGSNAASTATGGPSTIRTDEGPVDAKVVIIGSGPAGLTAAIYASRANLEPVVLAGSAPGGQLMLTSDVENYPGFEDAIQGPDLMAAMRAQAERFGSRLIDVDIDRVDFSERPFRIWARGTEYRAQAVVIATGASALWLGLESETRLRVLHRRETFRASKIMVDRANAHDKIEIHTNTAVTEVLGDSKVNGLRLADTETGEERQLPVDGLFIAIGYRPNTEAFRDWLDVDEKGYLIVHDETGSKIDGVFIAGDVHDHRYRQAVTAAADGCKAAIDAERWLESEGITEVATRTAW